MRKTLTTVISGIAITIGALGTSGVVAMSPAHASVVNVPAIDTLCDALPGIKPGLATDLDRATARLATATSTLTTKRAGMTTAISSFGGAVVTFLKVVDAGGNTTAAGDILRGNQAQFVDSVVAWSNARTAFFDTDRDVSFAQLRSSFIGSVEAAGCPAT